MLLFSFMLSFLFERRNFMDTQQFEVIRPKCAGLDVHKKSVVAAVCTSDSVTLTASYKTKVFNTTNSDIAAPRDWLLAQG